MSAPRYKRKRFVTHADINRVFHDAWAFFGDDKSTEFLIAFTAGSLGVSHSAVVDALAGASQ